MLDKYIELIENSNLSKKTKVNILENLKNNFKTPLISIKNILDVLMCFDWKKSKEGFDYWNKFYKRLSQPD